MPLLLRVCGRSTAGAGIGEAGDAEETTLGGIHDEGGMPAGEGTGTTGVDDACGLDWGDPGGEAGTDPGGEAGPGEASSSVAARATEPGVTGSSNQRRTHAAERRLLA